MEETMNKKEGLLEDFTTDITELAEKGLLDPVIGRENESKRLAQVLSRRTKNNPVLIGESGVGKTAIVELLAQNIVDGICPISLLDKRVLSLDMGSIVAGTKYRGEFEQRMKEIIKEIKERGNIIIFIDELHTMVGAGSSQGSLDASNILKPALSRGQIQCIGATTFDEYRNTVEKDKALERRFQKIVVEEPTKDQTYEILKMLKPRYEEYHNVRYTDNALKLCVDLSGRFITDRSFPDKAIDVLDESGSLSSVKNSVPKKLIDLKNDLSINQRLKNEAVEKQDFEQAVIHRNIVQELQNEIDEIKESIRNKKHKPTTIDEDDVRSVISNISKVPVDKVTIDDAKRYLLLEKILKENIIGQDEALTKISKVLRRNKTAISNPNKPIGTFLFTGNTGVGKTETAKVISEEIFGHNSLIRIDMSEYSEKISVSRLTGSAPGYVGYEEGGQLTESVRKKPFSVVLFDEIEKAHPEVFNVLLQILDEGRLTDNTGRTVNFRNTIIIMTSNVGVKKAQEMGVGIGFGNKNVDVSMKDNIMKEMNKKFAPEFLNRINEIIMFNQLSEDNIKDIVKIQLERLKGRIESVGFKLKWDNNIIDYISENSYEPKYGARPVERAIQTHIEDEISEALLEHNPKQGTIINIKKPKNSDKIVVTFK